MLKKALEIEFRGRDFLTGTLGKIGKSANSLMGAFSGLKGLFLGLGATAAFGSLINGAMEAEESEINLTRALKQRNLYTKENLELLQEQASALQWVSTVEDDTAMSAQKYALSMGATVQQANKLIFAAADMSKALGIDFTQASEMLAKSLTGKGKALAQLIPELREMTEEELRAGAAIDAVNAKFAGFATAGEKSMKETLVITVNNLKDQLEGLTLQLLEAIDLKKKLEGAKETVQTLSNPDIDWFVHIKDALSKMPLIGGAWVEDQSKNIQAELDANNARENQKSHDFMFGLMWQKKLKNDGLKEWKAFEKDHGLQQKLNDNERKHGIGNFLVSPTGQSLIEAVKQGASGIAGKASGLFGVLGDKASGIAGAFKGSAMAKTALNIEREMLELRASSGDKAAEKELERLKIVEKYAAVEREIAFQRNENNMTPQQVQDRMSEISRLRTAELSKLSSSSSAMNLANPGLLETKTLTGVAQSSQRMDYVMTIAKNSSEHVRIAKEEITILKTMVGELSQGDRINLIRR